MNKLQPEGLYQQKPEGLSCQITFTTTQIWYLQGLDQYTTPTIPNIHDYSIHIVYSKY